MKRLKQIAAAIALLFVSFSLCSCTQGGGIEPPGAEEAFDNSISKSHWVTGSFANNSGSFSGGPYVIGTFAGTFSRADADEANLTALLCYDGSQSELFFRLYEHGNNEVIFAKGDVINVYLDIFVKDSSANASPGTFGKYHCSYYNFNIGDSGIISSSADGLGKQLLDVLMDGGTVNIIISTVRADTGTAKYCFTADGGGFSSTCDELN